MQAFLKSLAGKKMPAGTKLGSAAVEQLALFINC